MGEIQQCYVRIIHLFTKGLQASHTNGKKISNSYMCFKDMQPVMYVFWEAIVFMTFQDLIMCQDLSTLGGMYLLLHNISDKILLNET